ncbi:Rpn family recombination-promoting nuclease/putative transposase [Lachnospiraceae bacterium ZAX-1]
MGKNFKSDKEFKEYWSSLGISDNFIFFKVMQDEGICKKLLEILLGIKISKIERHNSEKVMDNKKGGKGVRLDVYLEDENRAIDIEMQVEDKIDLAKRSRYYQSMIDLNILDSGEDYIELKESYVIFICMFDPLKKGLAEYSFENICIEDGEAIRLNDMAKKVFFNAMACFEAKDKRISEFLKYVCGLPSDDSFVKEIDQRVNIVKGREDWRNEYMKLSMIEMDARREGIEEGIEKGIMTLIRYMKKVNTLDDYIISELISEYDLRKEEAENYLQSYYKKIVE